jgi:uridylate kinase
LIKLSGEALAGDKGFGLDHETVNRLSDEVVSVIKTGASVGLVIGGGNIVRGSHLAKMGMDRVAADYMGMLGTIMNALALQNALEQIGVNTRVQSAIPMMTVCEPYVRRRAIRHMEKGRVVIFAAGLGSPFFTTDTPAALRAAEMGCDALLKGTGVDGVYSADPKKDPKAVRHDRLTYLDVLSRDLKVMDASAVALARDSKIPIVVFNIREKMNFVRVLQGKGLSTVISN